MSRAEELLMEYLDGADGRAGYRSSFGGSLEAAAMKKSSEQAKRKRRKLNDKEIARGASVQDIDARPRAGGSHGSEHDPFDRSPIWHRDVQHDRIVRAALQSLKSQERSLLLAVYAPPEAGVVVGMDKERHIRAPRLPRSVVNAFRDWAPLVPSHPIFIVHIDALAHDRKGRPFDAKSARERILYALGALSERSENTVMRSEITRACLASWRESIAHFVEGLNREGELRSGKRPFYPLDVPTSPMTGDAKNKRTARASAMRQPKLVEPPVPAEMRWELEAVKASVERRVEIDSALIGYRSGRG